MKIRAFVFDMDGTLLDSMPAWRSENRVILNEFGYQADAELTAQLPVLTSSDIAKRLETEGLGTFDSIIKRYIEHMAEHYINDVSPKPGAEAFLQLLYCGGVQIYLASSTPAPVTRKALEHFGFLKYFSGVFDDTSFGTPKSDPEFFRRLCRRINAAPLDCALFEDSAYAMLSARHSGLQIWGISDSVAARVPGKAERVQAASDIYVSDFHEAARIFVNIQ